MFVDELLSLILQLYVHICLSSAVFLYCKHPSVLSISLLKVLTTGVEFYDQQLINHSKLIKYKMLFIDDMVPPYKLGI